MVKFMQNGKKSIFNKSVATLLIMYSVSLLFTVLMLIIKTNLRYVFAAVSLLGYVAVAVFAIIKIIQYFIKKKK